MPNTLINMYNASGNKVAPAAGTTKTFTLDENDWTQSGDYYTQTVTVSGMTLKMNGIFAIDATSASDTVYNEAAKCQIRVIAQADPVSPATDGTITVKAAKCPTNPIPCVIIELGDE